jgi:hypothetical protein
VTGPREPNTVAAEAWAEILAEARAGIAMTMADLDLTVDSPHHSDLLDIGIAAGANATMDVLRRRGVLP